MRNTTKKITETAMWVATSVILDFISFYKMPNGGSASLSMLPLFIMIYRLGFSYGLIGLFSYGFINFLFDGAAYGLLSLLLDYFISFAALIISVIFRNEVKKGKIVYFELGILIGAFTRYIIHGISLKKFARSSLLQAFIKRSALQKLMQKDLKNTDSSFGKTAGTP